MYVNIGVDICEYLLQDEKLMKTNSITRRIKLYDKYCGFVDQHAVKMNFLRKVHRANPPFRTKIVMEGRKLCSIPEAIRMHYR